MTIQCLKIIADENIWGVKQVFGQLTDFDVNLNVIPSSCITADVVRDADVLLTRTGVRVDAQLLQGSTVRFAGTATIGDDHYDKTWLDEQSIAWATAAGSSTISVVEYILASLLEMQSQDRVDFKTMSLGIVGVGRIGSLLAHICERLGIHVLRNDPPRQRCEGKHDFVSLDELLKQADVITLHTPLIREGDDKTEQLFDSKTLAYFQGTGIINAARGQCVNNKALVDWLHADKKHWGVMDCWQHEPNILQELLAHPQCMLATPHIAGHSLDGKAANTQYIYKALCKHLDIEETWDMEAALPAVVCISDENEPWDVLMHRFYPIQQDSEALKAIASLDDTERGKQFVHLRRHYPIRRRWVKQSMKAKALFEGV
ncbi:MAG: 4-phosphoerythronate dehydrogenase [Mariprofundaceae bacterium]|nr:4-phosphoerythronate dehydrogenase [Mariprofundaceae bacterium]